MNQIPPDKLAALQQALAEGLSVRKAAVRVGLNKSTAHRYSRLIKHQAPPTRNRAKKVNKRRSLIVEFAEEEWDTLLLAARADGFPATKIDDFAKSAIVIVAKNALEDPLMELGPLRGRCLPPLTDDLREDVEAALMAEVNRSKQVRQHRMKINAKTKEKEEEEED